jgi:Xaa-Pro aminopeptidase
LINSEGIIISSGIQASMPHSVGSGPIMPNAPIICDIFPRDRNNQYFADMTRTYIKGVATLEQKKIYNTVKLAQESAIKFVNILVLISFFNSPFTSL